MTQPEDTKTRLLREFGEKFVKNEKFDVGRWGVATTHLHVKDFLSTALDTVERGAREEVLEAVEAEMADKIYYIGDTLHQVADDKRDKFVLLGYPVLFIRDVAMRVFKPEEKL